MGEKVTRNSEQSLREGGFAGMQPLLLAQKKKDGDTTSNPQISKAIGLDPSMRAAVENVDEGAKEVDGNQIDVLVAVSHPTECVTTGAFLMQRVMSGKAV